GLEQSVRRHALARQRQFSQRAQAAATIGPGAHHQGDVALTDAELHREYAQSPATAPLLAAGMAISIAAAAAATSELLFRNGIFLDIVPGAFAALISFIVMIVQSVRREQARKAFLEKAFGLYLAPEVISEMAASGQVLELGGTRRVLTVLFSDLQGFTSIAETLQPERLTAFMNRYLGLISEEILLRRGTLDKYVGDAVMAFWNAPLAEPRHPLLAILAAAAIQERLAREAQSFFQEFGVLPVTRIGIATGEAVVGNLGSRSRFTYTAIGDCVNVASRLEAANRVLGTRVLVADATVEQAATAPDSWLTVDDGSRQWTLRALGLGLLEGKQIPVRVWSFHGEEWSGGCTPWEGIISLSK
ncbi:MAG: adenylate/guanylate cyclase domain-containing protein, partial [Spirochaetales bacterium]|nr:adenylate/guanylate cyclase domain-containing protein [Spirochaetales bacterium]